MKEALKRYLLGMNSGLCLGAMLLAAGVIALNWVFRDTWMALDLGPTPMGWILEQHPSWKFTLLMGIPTVVGLLVIWAALALMTTGARTIKSSDRPWGAVYGTTFFFILVQAMTLGWFWLVPLAWPPTEPPKPVSSPSPNASPSPETSPSPEASPSPLKNPFANNPSASPSASPSDPFQGTAPSVPVAGAGSGRYVEFFDGLTQSVEREVDLARSFTPRQFGCRDGVLYWADGTHLTAVNLSTGSSVWRLDDAPEDEVQAVVSGLVLMRGQGRTLARRTSDGKQLWASQGTLLVDGDRIFEVAADEASLGRPLQGAAGVVQKLDPQTGGAKGEVVRLRTPVLEPQIDSGIIVGRITEPNNLLPVQDALTGSQLWNSNDVGAFMARSGRLYISVENGTYVRELRTGKPMVAGRTIPGTVVASFPGSFVMNDPVKQEYTGYDPATGASQWGWRGVQAWPLPGRDGMLLLLNENNTPGLVAYDGKGAQLFKAALEPALMMRAVVGAQDSKVVLLVEKPQASPSPAAP